MTTEKRFIYSASSAGVAARFDGPHALNRAWATANLPMIGGDEVSTVTGPAGNPVLSFTSATAHVKGWESAPGVFTTENTVTVTGLNILNRVTARKLEVRLRFIATANPEKLTVEVTANPYEELLIDGQNFSDVVFESDLALAAGEDHGKFRSQELPARRRGKHHIHKKLDTAFTTLSRDPKGRLTSEPTEHGYLAVADLGRIYFGEWAEEEDWQGVVGLRVALDSVQPQARGEIVIADWLGNNGQFYP